MNLEKMPLLIDSHAHLTCESVYPYIDKILESSSNAGIGKIINICTDVLTLERGLQLKERYPWIFNAASTTPHDVDKEGANVFPLMADHARRGNLIAVGETGLDYHYHHSAPETQKLYLKKYLNLALECRLPVIIHCRDAFSDFFEILDAEYKKDGKHAPGVLHCFTGTMQEAEEVLKRGWFLSLSGIVTFKKSTALQEVAKMVPLEQLLIETDTPYLAPQSKRGKLNSPEYLIEIAQFIADLKGISFEFLVENTVLNTNRLFFSN